MRGSHNSIFYPVGSDDSEIPTFFDGPPLVKALGMVVSDGEFSDPIYPFDFSFWDRVRQETSEAFREFRQRQGIFGPGTVNPSELEYGGWADIMDDLESQWELEAAETAADD